MAGEGRVDRGGLDGEQAGAPPAPPAGAQGAPAGPTAVDLGVLEARQREREAADLSAAADAAARTQTAILAS
jgi:hypothetical protein